MSHLTPTDIIAAAAVVTSVALGVATLLQTQANRRLDLRNKALEDEKRQMEVDKRQAEDEKRAEQERIAGIVKERGEIAAENRALRGELRLDIERLKDETTKSRNDAEHWRQIASDWESKYNRELLANTRLQESNLGMQASIARLEAEVITLRTRLNNITDTASSSKSQ